MVYLADAANSPTFPSRVQGWLVLLMLGMLRLVEWGCHMLLNCLVRFPLPPSLKTLRPTDMPPLPQIEKRVYRTVLQNKLHIVNSVLHGGIGG